MFVREFRNPVSVLKGAGPAAVAALNRLGVFTVADLLALYPRDYEDRSVAFPLAQWKTETVDTLMEVTGGEWFGYGRTRTWKAFVTDGVTLAVLVCFNRPFLAEKLVPGAKVFVRGKFDLKYGNLQSTAFELAPWEEGSDRPSGILPVYPLSLTLKQGQLRTLVKRACDECGKHVESEVPERLRERFGLMEKRDALLSIHFPASLAALELARKTLVFEELFELELTVGRRVTERRKRVIDRKVSNGILCARLKDRLPFSLTGDQESAVAKIIADMKSPLPMARLLQGDVGSGKTLVAFMAALECVETGGQAILLAPTELLARQHAENAARLLEPLGVRIAFLSGNVRASGRRPLLEALADGSLDFAVGTHALFQDDVKYAALRLVVIDEQHRFGVLERIAAMEKGDMPDVLMMSATPIPRTLALTVYGDLELTEIRTMPEGRKPIVTHLAAHRNDAKVYEFVRKELQKGRQAYFVYPLIEETGVSDLRDAESMASRLANEIFPEFRVGLAHSRRSDDDKRDTMHAFQERRLDILVATSVVEVGVDVANATCMIIEHADRFGLSALHQLRGRVGRGTEQSYCFLVYSEQLTPSAKDRLKVMLETNDGFAVAEEDLRIRGPGEIIGTAQSGDLKLSIADPSRDAPMLETARIEAFAILKDDPGLLTAENRVLARLFEKAPPFKDSVARG